MAKKQDYAIILCKFDYDALGRRIRRIKHDISETRLYYYNDNWQVLEEYECVSLHGTTMVNRYVYGNYIDEVLRKDDGTDAYYYSQDHLYSPVALLDTNGTVVERYEYNAYGKATVYTDKGTDGTWLTADDTTSTISALDNEYTFTGRRLDSLHANQLPLMYYRHRYYDPQMGRFLTRDPLGYYLDGLNLFEYTKSLPLNRLDPSGLFYMVPPHVPKPSPEELCDDWIEDESDDMNWINDIPHCPTNLPCDGSNPDSDIWEDPKDADQKYHPGADKCIRGKYEDIESGQQCCYSEDGNLITDGLGAGTPDRISPVGGIKNIKGVRGHLWEDVRMYKYCKKHLGDDWVEEKYNKVRPPCLGEERCDLQK
ncbi:Cell wall-associated polypeptide CWBP200 [Anaerohalosphaera lusitana]|uniref:Cell wall-associated polypeptide CWBP200 n=1 Tax=Anaerohalosphaera lusitana TaxID=1936003 RepID=A0A1U9NI69_9BACT|nr:RHS repeat-associated core domain-containing protein [Anaerohalosphaera lusitana]AQT67438.1 Cell wall-associated polypeptide CWBP200 [Anaerohalosphaera lusitana]